MPLSPTLTRALQFASLFLGLIIAIYAATQSQAAPLLILFIALYVLTSNFSIPLERTQVSLVPLVATSSLLIVGLEGALFALGLGLVLAELTRPLWTPLWQNITAVPGSWRLRLGLAGLYTAVLLIAHTIYTLRGGQLPLPPFLNPAIVETLPSNPNQESLLNLLWLTGAYLVAYLLGHALLSLLQRERPAQFVTRTLPLLIFFGLLTQTFALFGAFTYTAVGLPAYVIFAVGVGLFTIMTWVSWQNRVIMRQQVEQFAYLNRIGASLRATLDLPEVLQRTYEQVTQLIPADSFFIALRDDKGRWERPLAYHQGQKESRPDAYQPDDFTRWVAENGRLLDLDPDNMHHAARYDLAPPTPRPDAWLGVPLITSSKRPLGVLVIQRLPPSKPFTYWSRELLLAVAQQASTAIQNARLHAEAVRLFNLTDEQLARRVEQITAVLTSTHEGILMLDTAVRVLLINPLATQILDTQPELDAPLPDSLAHSRLGYDPATLEQLRAQLAAGTEPPPRQTIYALPAPVADRPTYIERTERPVLSQDGQIMGWLLVLRDVTEEQEQAQWRRQFTHMIVHDLRNPVTTLLSTLRLLERQLPHAPLADLTSLVETAQYGCHHLLDMVDSLMDINRLEAGQLIVEAEAMRLPSLVERVRAHMQSLADEKQVTLTAVVLPRRQAQGAAVAEPVALRQAQGAAVAELVEAEPAALRQAQGTDGTVAEPVEAQLPAVWADEELVRRILVNLLDNALKFTPAHGRVTIQLQPDPQPIQGYEQGILCTITDSGLGIPADQRDRIFERFVRISRGGAQVRGTGIGLSFCRLALEAQDGRIWVEDAPAGEQGSRFLFTLPGIPLFDSFSQSHG